MAVRVGRIGTAYEDDTRAAAFVRQMTGRWREVTFRSRPTGGMNFPTDLPAQFGGAPAFTPRTVEWGEGNIDLDVVDQALDVLLDVVKSNSETTEGLPMEAVFEVDGPPGETRSVTFSFTGAPAENYGADLEFGDKSAATVLPDRGEDQDGQGERPPTDSRPLDHPARLQEPITQDEYGNLEILLERLSEILDQAAPDDVIRLRVEGALGVLRGTHRATVVGETRRGDIVPVVRSVVRAMATQLPAGIVVWDKAIEILGKWYPSVVRIIEQIVS